MSRRSLRARVALAGVLAALAAALPAWPGAPAPLHAAELQIEAPRFTFDQASNTYTYEDGKLTLGEMSIFASHMELNPATGAVHATGRVRIETPEVTGTGESLEMDATTRVGTLHQADLFVIRSGLFVRAEEVTLRADGSLLVRGCTLTSCRPEVPAGWHIAASSLELEREGLGVAWNPRLFVGGVPFLWLPALAWPTTNERRTGLLTPRPYRQTSSLARFDLGWRLQLPVFVNLGYDHDVTVTPDWVQNRGTGLELEYNYAFWSAQRGRLTLWGLRERDARVPADENTTILPAPTPGSDPLARYRADWLHNQALGEDGRLVLSYHDSSDGQVRKEYDRIGEYRPFRTYQASLTDQWRWGDAALTFDQNAHYVDESVYARGTDYSDLANYPQLLPRASLRLGGRPLEALPLGLELGLSVARFEASAVIGGRVLTASPSLSLPIALGGAWELRPTVTRRVVSYNGLLDAAGTAQPDETFAQSEASVELRTALARVYPSEEGSYAAIKHRIVPRLIFTGVQDVAQPYLAQPAVLTDGVLRARPAERLVTLRLDNVWLGKARAAAPPPTSLAPTPADPTLLPGEGAPDAPVNELVRLDVIQRYNLLLADGAPALVGPLPGEWQGLPARRQETDPGQPLLPLLVELSANGRQLSASARVNYHHQLHRNTETELKLSGSTTPGTALSVGYTSNEFAYVTPDDKVVSDGKTLSFGASSAWKDAWALGVSGRVNLSDGTPPLDRRLDRGEVFVEYHPACYLVRVSYLEQVDSTLQGATPTFYLDRRFSITFELSGLVGGPVPPRTVPTPQTATAYGPGEPSTAARCHG
jgi:hypothetical protein